MWDDNAYSNIIPPSIISLDEIVVKGFHRFRLYRSLRHKPDKNGAQLPATRTTDGVYLRTYFPHAGEPKAGILAHQVEYLIKNTSIHNGAIYCADNLCITLAICILMYQKYGVNIYGTGKKSKNQLPECFHDSSAIYKAFAKEPKGSWIVMYKDGVAAYLWNDSKPVIFLTTFHTPEQELVERRVRGHSERLLRKAPSVAASYNYDMPGVDVSDQLKGVYAHGFKTGKWWHPFLWRMWGDSRGSGWRLFNKVAQSPLTHRAYTEQLVVAYVTPLLPPPLYFPLSKASDRRRSQSPKGRSKRGRPLSLTKVMQSKPTMSAEAHFPIDQRFTDPKAKVGECARCAQERDRHSTHIYCSQCRIFLCLDRGCFFKVHGLHAVPPRKDK